MNFNKVYIIAEMSANHNQNLEKAKEIIIEAKNCGADAVKIQTFTADPVTIDVKNEYFKIPLYPDYQNLYNIGFFANF